jgi:hypothetical protein
MDKQGNPTRKEAIQTQCWECMGHYADGKQDCENVVCPLYYFMPYRKLEPDFGKFKYNPKFKGKVTREEASQRGFGKE